MPLRRDAQRNRERIIEAAGEVFATRGFAATLDDVAHHAGVGVGTVYRRFPTKEELIDAVFTDRLEDLVTLAEEALTAPSAWEGLTGFLRTSARWHAADRGLRPGPPQGLRGRRGVGRLAAHPDRGTGPHRGCAAAGGIARVPQPRSGYCWCSGCGGGRLQQRWRPGREPLADSGRRRMAGGPRGCRGTRRGHHHGGPSEAHADGSTRPRWCRPGRYFRPAPHARGGSRATLRVPPRCAARSHQGTIDQPGGHSGRAAALAGWQGA
ncbi:TetR/AcrR family transcriptional regulator [Actinoplanes philippinensis]|uniref:TetR/AcrR family transcriptional regulator n=1 Tax=Actinoplanes philippinensis TaxID=35752 RepID=UPI003F4CF73F